ncbi:hypothetical protein GGD38_005083 [Chitinophagaceae bacterium OAS944]|nr:hypothetical protein [Chitinophagaceae bacterium OAS944]
MKNVILILLKTIKSLAVKVSESLPDVSGGFHFI